MRHIFIVNPVAGKAKNLNAFKEHVDNFFKERGLDYTWHVTTKPQEATEIVRLLSDSPDTLRFYACGGDGTANEVLHGLEGKENCQLAVIPQGSGNDFLRNFENKEYFSSLKAQIEGEVVLVDVLTANERLALNLINVGLDGDTGYYKKRFQRIPGVNGPMAYNLALVFCFFKRYGVKLKIEADGHKIEAPKGYVLTAYGNGTTYGSGYEATPRAIINDGLIDVCLFNQVSRFTILRYLAVFKKGLHVENPALQKILYYKKHKKVNLKAEDELHICIDGEFFDSSDVEIGIKPMALNFVLPKGAFLRQSGQSM